MKKAVHFGAGSIGMGLIGERLHASGYHVTFLDVSSEIVRQINTNAGYDLYLINHDLEKIHIDAVDAVNSIEDVETAIQKIEACDLLTTSVWPGNLPKIAKTVAAGLERRYAAKAPRLEVMACENAMFASNMLKEEVQKVTSLTNEQLEETATFVNTAIARMVIDSSHDGQKTVDIADDFEISVAVNELNDPNVQPILGADYTTDLKAYIERKLFIVNSAHCIAGYLGVLQGKKFVRECFEDAALCNEVRTAMLEAAQYISIVHGFTMEDLEKFIDKTIKRYKTPGVNDDLTRVCRTPIRKVGKNDRLVLPILGCEDKKLNNQVLCKGLAAAYAYTYPEDAQAVELQEFIAENGIENAVQRYSEITDPVLLDKIVKAYNAFREDI